MTHCTAADAQGILKFKCEATTPVPYLEEPDIGMKPRYSLHFARFFRTC